MGRFVHKTGKVYPNEVESILLQMPNIMDAQVWGAANPIMGQVIVARLTVNEEETLASVRQRLRAFCRNRLAPYKIPVEILLGEPTEVSYRFKRTHH